MKDAATNYLLALLSGLLLILLYPRFDWTWLAPVALTPLLLAALRERRPLHRFLLGYAAGNLFWFVVCNWIQFVLEVHGGMGFWGGWGTFFLFSLYKGLHLGVFAMLAGWLMPRPWAVPGVAALWVGIERTHGTFGFAWLTLGNAASDMGVLLRMAPFTGVYGMSFVFALTAAALALVILRRPRWQFLCVALLPLMYLLPRLPEPAAPTQTAIVLQSNVPEDTEWTIRTVDETIQRELRRSLIAMVGNGGNEPKLIVWPEAPLPVSYFRNEDFREQANNLARTTGSYFLLGTVGQTKAREPLNSAVLISPQGEALDRYDKVYLVPFGEFVPPLFGWVNKISQEAGNFVEGTRIVVFPFASHKLGSFICYESAFPHLVRQFPKAGADILVNISNDGYFGGKAAREQHLNLVRMRAVENRRWIIRSTNDGITATVDPAGRIVERLAPFEETAAAVHYGFVEGTTFYTEHGDWFAWGCLLAGLGAVGQAIFAEFRSRNI